MANPTVVFLACGPQVSAFQVGGWPQLRDAAVEAYGPLLTDPTQELALCYKYDGETLEVKSAATFSTFLALHQHGLLREVPEGAEGVRPGTLVLAVSQRPKLNGIPKLRLPGTAAPPAPAPGAPAKKPAAGHQNHASEEKSRGPAKALMIVNPSPANMSTIARR